MGRSDGNGSEVRSSGCDRDGGFGDGSFRAPGSGHDGPHGDGAAGRERRASRGRDSGDGKGVPGCTGTRQRRREGSDGPHGDETAAAGRERRAARGRGSGSRKEAPENTRTGQPHQKRGVGQQEVRMSGGRDRPHRAAGANGHRRIQGRISPSAVRPARRRRSARTAA